MDQLIIELSNLNEMGFATTSINIALTIPDICGALDSADGSATSERYKAWVDKYLSPNYNGFINGEDIWKLRCAALHQGRLNHKNPKYEKIIFKIDKNFVMHNNVFNDTLQLSSYIFVNDILSGYERWKIDNEENENYIKNIEHSFKYFNNGYPGVINVGHFLG